MSIFRRKQNEGPRRQWGADANKDPMPQVPRIAGDWTMTFGRFAVVFTVAAWAALFVTVVNGQVIEGVAGHASLIETIGFLTAVTLLAASAIAYLFGRLGFYYRTKDGRRTPRAMLDEFYAERRPSVTALIPSYQEEPGVILMTLLSTALQEYPDVRVVLLIDDPPNPRYAGPRRLLDSAVALPAEVERLLSGPRRRFDLALERFESSFDPGAPTSEDEVHTLAGEYEYAASWIASLGDQYHVSDHNEAFFANHVLGKLSADLAVIGRALRTAADDAPEKIDRARLSQLYCRLAWTFRAEVSSFQRKRFASLSAEPNKAMNLNTYIALLGKRYDEREHADGVHLVETTGAAAMLEVPQASYLITLDADSLLMPGYALRLVAVMESPGNERIAVAQTPYSAVPGPAEALERTAGATTDIQYLIHQGFTQHHATFWVGANALLRHAPLHDIAVVADENGKPVRRYIQDRTVIEDTESTVDLIDKGWRLYNYPERLAYSATPADFGALVVQRARWANGGLIILPKLLRYLLSGPRRLQKLREGFFRVHYLTSIAGVNLGLLVVLGYPFPDSLQSPWLPLTALPYYALYARDLRQAGYCKGTDLLRVYALNLLLLPVNVGGVLRSLHQAWKGHRIPFLRTPKIAGRTRVPARYIAALFAIAAVCFGAGLQDLCEGNVVHSLFSFVNGVLFVYALATFVGFAAAWDDLNRGIDGAVRRLRPSLPPEHVSVYE